MVGDDLNKAAPVRDWVAELRRILQLGPANERKSPAPESKHRSTKKMVQEILDQLAIGVRLPRNIDTTEHDIQQLLFKAIDRMLLDKVAESDKGKTRQQALDAFEARMQAQFAARDGQRGKAVDDEWQDRLKVAVRDLRFEDRRAAYAGGGGSAQERQAFRRDLLGTPAGQKSLRANPAFASTVIRDMARDDSAEWLDAKQVATRESVLLLRAAYGGADAPTRKLIYDRMMTTPDGRAAAVRNPAFAGELLADRPAAELMALDLDTLFGAGKAPVAAEALIKVSNRAADKLSGIAFDPALFRKLQADVDVDTWNDSAGTGRGLGPRIGMALWQLGQHDEIVRLMERGVDTSKAARVEGETGKGTYSGFVQPLQHVASRLLREVAEADRISEQRCNQLRPQIEQRMKALEPSVSDKRTQAWRQALAQANALSNTPDPAGALVALQALAKAIGERGVQAAKSAEQKKAQQDFESARAQYDKPLGLKLEVKTTEHDVAGARKIMAALQARDAKARLRDGPDADQAAVCLTSWSEVKASPMVRAFTADPGTIWGFEDIRMPFVQAGHEAKRDAAQEPAPIRMMEIWNAVKRSFPPQAFEDLLRDPDQAIKTFVTEGKANLDHMAQGADAEAFKRNYERDATTFFKTLIGSMPKTAMTERFVDASGKTAQRGPDDFHMVDVRTTDMMGVDQDKYLSSHACKVGLWWAKEQDQPVYYCLDGINMDDVINYKAVKNRSIAAFIDGGGVTESAQAFSEVVTMKELREILRNWDELKRKNGNPLIKFVLKGQMLDAGEVDAKVKVWRQAMLDANKAAGRAKAPPKASFATQLDALDPRLMAQLPNTPEGDQDARDIVKKATLLRKVSRTRPAILLKYLMSRCFVLEQYGLISSHLARAAAAYAKATPDTAPVLRRDLLAEINLCNAAFRPALTDSLLAGV